MDEATYKSYVQDAAQFNKQCESNWRSYWDQHKDEVKEGLQLYANYSQELADRKKDESLSRSCLHIPVICPAVLARAAYQTNTFFSVEKPIKVEPGEGTSRQVADNVESWVDECLYRDGFKEKYLRMQIAKETYPIVFWRVSEMEDEDTLLQLVEKPLDLEGLIEHGQMTVEKEWVKGPKRWRPTVTSYTMDQVFYDVKSPTWKAVTYAGIINHLSRAELEERKETMDYKFSDADLKAKAVKVSSEDFQEAVRSSVSDPTKEDTGGEVRYKVLENDVLVTNEEGKAEWKTIHSSGGCLFKDVAFGHKKFQRPPMVPMFCYPGINEIHGISTVDLLRYIQHATNDAFNIVYDAGKYGNFPPLIQDSRLTIHTEKKIGPGNIWVGDVDGGSGATLDSATELIKPLYQMTPMDQKFFVILDNLKALAQQVSAAHGDILGGEATDPKEKATKTTVRVKGAATRLSGINILLDVEAIKELAFFIWAMTLEALPVEEFVQVKEGIDPETGDPITRNLSVADLNGEVTFGVPHLEEMADKEIKAEKLFNFWGVVKDEVFFAAEHPAGLQARYGYLKKLAHAMGIEDFEKIVTPEVVNQLGIAIEEAQKAAAAESIEQAMSEVEKGGQGAQE